MSALDESRKLLEEARALAAERKAEEKKRSGTQSRSSRRNSRSGRKANATGPIEPGFIHVELANLLLEGFGAWLAKQLDNQPREVGSTVEIDLGNEIEYVAEDGSAVSEDEAQPAEILARVIARVFRNTPGLKKVEKHFEGKDKRAGLGSDFLALCIQLGRRNKHLWPMLKQQFKAQAAAAKQKKTTAEVPQPRPQERREV